ncbi:MAG: four helix bundle protein [Lysobacterales bacterium]
MVWQRAMELAVEAYSLAAALPNDERFGLARQIKRSAVSVPSNIAEGHERRSTREYARHVAIACGSLAELETQIELCLRLGFIEPKAVEQCNNLASETGRMLRAIERSLRANLGIGEGKAGYGTWDEATAALPDPSALSPQP